MPLCKLYDIIPEIEPTSRIMGLDVGKKTIGIALGDLGHKIATPHDILWRRKFTPDAQLLCELIDRFEIGCLVVGWPLNMDGSQGPKCDSVRDFAYAFMRIRDIPICFIDERLSTQAVERAMIDADMTRKNRHQRRDALAASWILQSAFDSWNSQKSADQTA